MADLTSLQQRLSDLGSQGKTLSTSKEYAKVYNQIKSMGGSTSKGSIGSSGAINSAIAAAQKAVQPAVDSANKIASSISDRYDQLINDIKGQQETALNKQTVTTQNELGRRGIIGGGLAEQELTSALQPIRSDYTSQMTQAGNSTQDYLNNLAMQIAQLQSNAGLTGLTTGINQYNADRNYSLQQQNLAAQQQAAQQDAAYKNLIYKTIQLPESQYTINKPYYKPDDSTSGLTAESFLSQIFGTPNQTPALPSYFTPYKQ